MGTVVGLTSRACGVTGWRAGMSDLVLNERCQTLLVYWVIKCLQDFGYSLFDN